MNLYTLSRIPEGDARDYLASVKASLRARGEPRAPVEVFCAAIRKNLAANRLNYLRFGPYWWAVKAILNENGGAYGERTERALAEAYRITGSGGETDAEATLIAAWMFWEAYDGTRIRGSRDFTLSEDGGEYVLLDRDMEAVA